MLSRPWEGSSADVMPSRVPCPPGLRVCPEASYKSTSSTNTAFPGFQGSRNDSLLNLKRLEQLGGLVGLGVAKYPVSDPTCWRV